MNSELTWWQSLPERMNPVIFQIGSFSLQYYGLMYLLAFITTYILIKYRLSREQGFSTTMEDIQILFSAIVLGVLIGGRLGYVIFYNFQYYLQNPLEIILPFDVRNGWRFTGIAGMSFHGGLIGVIVAWLIVYRRLDGNRWEPADLFSSCAPLGYTFGRIGNFINGELYGRATESRLGMRFPSAPGNALRHPSQLYEAAFEGVALFAILWALRMKIRIRGAMLPFYLVGYGFFRFIIEFTREPDAHLGFVFLKLSMGQMLCLVMIFAGIILYFALRKNNQKQEKRTKGKNHGPSKSPAPAHRSSGHRRNRR